MPWLTTLYWRMRRGATLGSYIGCSLLFGSAALTTAEVFARRFFGTSLVGVDELSGYALAISMAWAYGFAAFERAHIRVDSVYTLLPMKVRQILDILALAALGLFLALLVIYSFGVLSESVRIGSRSNSQLETLLWIPQSVWFCGLLFCLASTAVILAFACSALAHGQGAIVSAIAGTASVQDIIASDSPSGSARTPPASVTNVDEGGMA
jgi:TRAP-type C4-dicarboxylate transport system permease small subunit